MNATTLLSLKQHRQTDQQCSILLRQDSARIKNNLIVLNPANDRCLLPAQVLGALPYWACQ